MRAAGDRRAGLLDLAQVAAVHLTALAHPQRCRPLVGDADLEVRVAEQAPHDRRADQAGAARDEDSAHVRSAAISFV